MKTLLPLTLALLALSACSSVQYEDPDKVEELTIDFGSTDLQNMAGKMADSMISAPQLSSYEHLGKGEDKRAMIFTGVVENRTSEHIDTQGITDSIRVSLLKSGKFRLTASKSGQAEIGEQVEFQQGSGRVSLETAKAFGKQLGADLVVHGTLRSIEKEKGRSIESGGTKKDDVYYQFVLECVDLETGEILWIDEAEFRKFAKTGLFGG